MSEKLAPLGGKSARAGPKRRGSVSNALMDLEAKGFKKTRRLKWVFLVFLAQRTIELKRAFTENYEQAPSRIAKHVSAGKFQQTYRCHLLSRVLPHVSYLCKDGWQFMLAMRIKRKRLKTAAIEAFIHECIAIQCASRCLHVFRLLLHRIVVTQRAAKKYLSCKKARLFVLGRLWNKIEKQMEAERKKNAIDLNSLSHQRHLGLGRLDEELQKKMSRIKDQQLANSKSKRTAKLLRDVVSKRRQAENFVFNNLKKKTIAEYLYKIRKEHAEDAYIKMQVQINTLRHQAKRRSILATDLEGMRDMLNSGSFVNKSSIGSYLVQHSKGHNDIAKAVFKDWPPFMMLTRSPAERIQELIEATQETCRHIDKTETADVSAKLMNGSLRSRLTESKEARGFNNLVGMSLLSNLTEKIGPPSLPVAQ